MQKIIQKYVTHRKEEVELYIGIVIEKIELLG